MKRFFKYLFPALYGLLIYFTIRMLHDLAVDSQFWKRDWRLNIFEIVCSMIAGFVTINLFQWLFRNYERRWLMQLRYERVLSELLILILLGLIVDFVILIPMAAFTDDGLSWGDVADLTTIPTLYAIIYYGIVRSRTWLHAYIHSKLQLEKLSHVQLETELKFLKAQYHPHFLFNALNTIYFQMDDDLVGAKRSIEKFSELLRYQLYDQQQKVPVLQELEYIQSYIELQRVRITDKLKLKVVIDKQLNDQLLYPLLFLPLVENAFKFVSGDYELLVSAQLEAGSIKFSVVNSISAVRPDPKKSGGIGLDNLRRRLHLLYPKRHHLNIEETKEIFKVELILDNE